MESLSRSTAIYSHTDGGLGLLHPSLGSRSARYIAKVSFLHVAPGTGCKQMSKGTAVDVDGLGSDPAHHSSCVTLGKFLTLP